jgi:hypothetical protein
MAKHVLSWIVSVAASRLTVMPPLRLITAFPTPGGPTSEGVFDPSLYRVSDEMIKALLPVAIVCAVSLLGMAVWSLVTQVHLRLRGGRGA